MTSTGPSADAQGDLDILIDDAVVSAAGVGTRDSFSSACLFFPFTLSAYLQRQYFKQLLRFLNIAVLQTFAGGGTSGCCAGSG